MTDVRNCYVWVCRRKPKENKYYMKIVMEDLNKTKCCGKDYNNLSIIYTKTKPVVRYKRTKKNQSRRKNPT